jgi:hypothetical protein
MKSNDVQLGRPEVIYKDTAANIEAITPDAGAVAYATDTKVMGIYDGAVWSWITSSSESGDVPPALKVLVSRSFR